MKIGSVVTPEWKLRVVGAISLALLVTYVGWGPCIPHVWAQDRAQETSVRDTAAARVLFEEGVACADRGDWTCAADRFERAQALRASPVIAYNLGHALVELGRLVEGTEILRRLARDARVPEAVRRDAAHVVSETEPRIGRLAVHVSGPLDGVAITIDGIELAPSLIGTAAPIDPGAHVVEARRGGEVVASDRVEIAAGGAARVELSVPPAPELPAESAVAAVPSPEAVALAAVPPTESTAPRDGGDEGPWIALGVTGAVLVVGAIVLAVVLAQPADEASPFDGNLGRVEIGP